jgi:hypothetical protein
MSNPLQFIVQNACPYDLSLYVDPDNNNCIDTEFITPPNFLGSTFDIPAGGRFTATLYRKDGHGCNGRQGEFQARPTFLVDGVGIARSMQQFSFDSDGNMFLVNAPGDYVSRSIARAGFCEWSIQEPITADVKYDCIRQNAPIVWLAAGEEYFPSSVEWSFPNLVRVMGPDGNYWLNTRQALSSPSDDSLPYFAGNLSSAPVYAFWIPKNGACYDIVYFFYFPYNRGKQALNTVWGNHVGDWEHVTVRLDTALQPIMVYFSQHDGGAILSWADVEKQGAQPVVYSAWGSHGSYPTAGNHSYGPLNSLTDVCSRGTHWNTASSIAAFDYLLQQPLLPPPVTPGPMPGPIIQSAQGLRAAPVPGYPSWMSTAFTQAGPNPSDPASGAIYRWGNPSQGCITFPTTICRLEDGPTGPVSKSDCWDPNKFA